MTALFDDYDTDTELRMNAERVAQYRARKRRDKLVTRIGVLDELVTGRTEVLRRAHPALGEVAEFFGIDCGPLHTLLRLRREEFLSDGWRHDRWTDEAIIRAALLLEDGESEAADEIRYHLRESELPVVYSSHARRIDQCAKDYERAMSLIEAVHGGESAHDTWRRLQDMPRYELQALAIAAAALVPEDADNLGAYLKAICGRNGSVAQGLALLIPRPSKLYRRRRSAGRRRYIDQPGGVSVTAQR